MKRESTEPSTIAKPYRLRVLSGEVELGRYVLAEGDNVVGGAGNANVVIAHENVSRRHAVVRVGKRVVSVRDLGSKNGTYVNGKAVRSCKVEAGDVINFGPVEAVLEVIEQGDAVLALAFSEDAIEGGDTRSTRTETETDRGIAGGADAGWLRLVCDLGEEILGPGRRDIGNALQILVEGLGATAAWLAEVHPETIVIHGSVGPFEAGRLKDLLGDRIDVIRSTASAAKGSLAVDGPNAGQSVACCWSGSHSSPPTVLAVAGDDRGRTWSLSLIEHSLQLFMAPVLNDVPDSGSQTRGALPRLTFSNGYVVARSEPMRRVYDQLQSVAGRSFRVLISGETGVGKEDAARILHDSSPHQKGPFVPINCAAIPPELFESELFGIERGVATGVDARHGFFQRSHGGTLFLDEISEVPRAMQAKLLRAIQDRLICRVGSGRPEEIDVNIISATNRDPGTLLRSGALREDLYYRLAEFRVHIPPLRERREDIAPLMNAFLTREIEASGKRLRGLTAAALDRLTRAPWPGNVRELNNVMMRLVASCPDGGVVDSSSVASAVADASAQQTLGRSDTSSDFDHKAQIAVLERRLIISALEQTGGNRAAAAHLLHITANGLAKKIDRLGIDARPTRLNRSQ